MMTVTEVAKQLGVSKRLVYKLVSSGELASYRIGSAIRISERHVREYLERPPEENRSSEFKHLRL